MYDGYGVCKGNIFVCIISCCVKIVVVVYKCVCEVFVVGLNCWVDGNWIYGESCVDFIVMK